MRAASGAVRHECPLGYRPLRGLCASLRFPVLEEIEKPSMPNRPLRPALPKLPSERGKRGAFLVRWAIGILVSLASPFGEASETSGISAV